MLCAVHTSGNGARPSGQQYSLSAAATLCQQIAPHFASQLHGTNLEPLAFALATTIPCWAIPCWAIATESCDYKLFFFSRTSSLRPLLFLKKKKKNVPQERGQEILPSLVCNATPELSWCMMMMVTDFASQHITTPVTLDWDTVLYDN